MGPISNRLLISRQVNDRAIQGIKMMKTKFILLTLGILHMMISGDAGDPANRTIPTEEIEARPISTRSEKIEAQLEKEIKSLKNESAEGSFNDPKSEPSEETAAKYYNLVLSSDGDDTLNFKYVSAIGYIKPTPFGFCEDGPVWAIHYVPGFFFWPPIPKRVCARPCTFFGGRCRASCCETECVYRYVWRCMSTYCRRWGWKQICYDQHYSCKCTCRFSSPYCYL